MCPGGLPIKDAENWQAGFLPGSLQGTHVDTQHTELSRTDRKHRTSAHFEHQINGDSWTCFSSGIANILSERRDDRMEARIQSYELAFRMQQDAAEAFDISREPKHIQDAYGDGVHGRQTLIARRLG